MSVYLQVHIWRPIRFTELQRDLGDTGDYSESDDFCKARSDIKATSARYFDAFLQHFMIVENCLVPVRSACDDRVCNLPSKCEARERWVYRAHGRKKRLV